MEIKEIRTRTATYRDNYRVWTGQVKTRLHFFHDQDESVLEQMVNRRNRPYEVFRQFVPIVLDGAPEGTRVNWSQYAGCSCGCSPAFIVTKGSGSGALRDKDDNNKVITDIFVHLVGAPKTADEGLPAARAARNVGVGRGPTGRLRNFKAMNRAKLVSVLEDVHYEGSDKEAMDAIVAELATRG